MFTTLTTLDGEKIPVNKSLVMYVRTEGAGSAAKTWITFHSGARLAVKESLSDVTYILLRG